ncbi:MAG: type I pullulanase [Lachnospiraceae bacterium]|nr:type I pullulanase [Lachnospiraceae bacterium]
MKQMKRRVHALVLAVIMVLISVIGNYTPDKNVYAADSTTVVIHYQRDDGTYDNWNVWAWTDTEGKQYNFNYEDSYGKVAVVQLQSLAEEVGFIIRLGDWEDKDCADDRFITVNDGFAEIWVTSGEAEFATTAPAGAETFDLTQITTVEDPNTSDTPSTPSTPSGEGDLTVNLHYHRYDEAYDGWNIWFWPEGGDGARYEFNGTDDFGVVSSVNFDSSVTSLGFIVKLNEWDQKECDMDRYIDTTKAVDGVIDVWLIQADTNIYYDYSEVDLSPKFLGASLTTAKRIAVKVTTPIDADDENIMNEFSVEDTEGNSYELMNVFSTGSSNVTSTFNINMQEPLDLSKRYIVKSPTYGEFEISYGEVFSTDEFEEQFYYDGDDLGSTWSKESTTFKVWSPTATKVVLNLYENGNDGDAYEQIEMTLGEKGVWETTVTGDLNKVYYTYTFTNAGTEREAVDLYARTTGVNGKRGMVIDLDSTDPEGWENDKRPGVIKNATDATIYELHIRDFTIDESSGVTNKGKYLGLTEKGTKNATGQSTCLDHLANLGITHIQILPMYDYSPYSVNEEKLDEAQFNWGYDPYNYNVPEGSYSTDPYNGEVRVNEMKQMIQALHNEDIGVIMDVVYNHTAETDNSYFSITVPDYYYRHNANGGYSNASGCGNEVASERAMVRKYIVDSVVYWATEYHIDGFRFDLMGILDIETMNAVRAALNEIDPTILVYGEGWTGGDSALNASLRAMKVNTYKMENVGAFSDDIRDGIKGSVFDAADQGFVTGKSGQEERIKSGIIGATDYVGINWAATGTDVGDSWTNSPVQAINYVSCHDNLTLWDKINSSNADDTLEDRVKMNNLCASIVYTAQGIPFMLSGEEILRTKPNESGTGFDHNSYKSSDYTNSIKWDTLNDETTASVLEYYKGLIAFRKAHSGLRMTTAEDVNNNLSFLEVKDENVVAYVIENSPNGETAEKICVIYNANKEAVKVTVPEGEWKVCIKNDKAGTETIETIEGTEVTVDAISCLAMIQEAEATFPWIPVMIAVVAVIIVAAIALIVVKKVKK